MITFLPVSEVHTAPLLLYRSGGGLARLIRDVLGRTRLVTESFKRESIVVIPVAAVLPLARRIPFP